MSNFVFQHTNVVLDADCTISLEASGQLEPVLTSAPCRFSITRYVYRQEILRANLNPFIERGILTVAELKGAEEDTMVNLSARGLDNGEASCGAVAIHRNWGIGIDDIAARNYFAKHYPHLQLISVVHLVKHWVDIHAPSRDDVRAVMRAIEDAGGYRPGPRHPLYQWWKACLIG
jgi:hypothetical protein